jgi:hypothetical protein
MIGLFWVYLLRSQFLIVVATQSHEEGLNTLDVLRVAKKAAQNSPGFEPWITVNPVY